MASYLDKDGLSYFWGKVKAKMPSAYNVAPAMDGTANAGSSSAYARGDHVHPTDTSRAPLASPALTGTPTAPTASLGTDTTQIATTAFVKASIDNISKNPDTTGVTTSPNIVYNVAQSAGKITVDKAPVSNVLNAEAAEMLAFTQSGGVITLLGNSRTFTSLANIYNSQLKINCIEVVQAVGGTYTQIRNYEISYVNAVNQTITLTSADDTKLYVVVLTCTSGTISGGTYTEVAIGGGGNGETDLSDLVWYDKTSDFYDSETYDPIDTLTVELTHGTDEYGYDMYYADLSDYAGVGEPSSLTDVFKYTANGYTTISYAETATNGYKVSVYDGDGQYMMIEWDTVQHEYIYKQSREATTATISLFLLQYIYPTPLFETAIKEYLDNYFTNADTTSY